MSLQPLTDAGDVKRAIASLKLNLTRSCVQMNRFIGWQGGGQNFRVYWSAGLRMWWKLYRSSGGSRYVCFFGFQDPNRSKNLTIICEVNPPCQGFDRRTAGVLVRDDAGRIFLAHTGKIGGGRPGVGKSSFISACGGDQMEPIVWPDRKETEVFVIGRVDSSRLASQIRDFVAQVKEFKDSAKDHKRSRKWGPPRLLFKPEFEGPRKGYRVEGKIESRCDHGSVINTLKAILQKRLGRIGRDRERDLYVMSAKGRITHLLEAKTDVSTSSIYCAVGQLMLHGVASSPTPRRILVVPRTPKERTRTALKSLGIRVLTYTWTRQRPLFARVDEVLE